MWFSRRRSWPLLALLIGCYSLALQGADPPAKTPGKSIDISKFPPGTIFIVGDDAKDLQQQPGVVVLTQEEFQKMRDELNQLKKQSGSDKPVFAGKCEISGRVEGDLAHLQVRYHFETTKAKALVPLGCKNAWPTAASLDDGRLPLLPPPGEDGFVVQIDKPGPHRLTLDLDVAIAPRTAKGTERGFDLNLPGAAVTLLEFLDLPAAIPDVRIVGRSFTAADLSSKNDRRIIALGPIERLDVTWKGQAPRQQADPLLAAQGKIDVTVDDTHVTTDVELKLEVLRGQTNLWKLHIPPGPQISVDPDLPAGDERAPVVEKPADAKSPIWLVKLKDASSEPLPLRIRIQQIKTKTVGIGPIIVMGAVRQQGKIKVTVPPELRVRFRTRGDIGQREVGDDQKRGNSTVALFEYWNLPQPQPMKEAQPVPAPLDLDIEPVKGAVETAVNHFLKLTPQGWQVTSEIEVKPERIEIDRLEVDLPANYEVKASPPSHVEPELEFKDAAQPRRTGIIKLTQRRSTPFKFVLTGSWPVPEEPRAGLVTIALPRPIQTLDRGGRVTVIVPDNRELFIVRESGMQTLPPGKRQYTLETDRAPLRVEVAWRDYRPELPVEMFVDLTLTDRQALVRQRIRFLFPLESMRQVTLRGLDWPPDRVPMAERVPLIAEGPGAWSVALKESALTLEYAFRPQLDKTTGSFAVPLLWPDGMSHCQTKVRIWNDPGTQPLVEGRQWEEWPLEVVPERDSLPALVLRASGLQVPLRLKQRAVSPLPTVTIERALIQAVVGDGGHQVYRARFLIGKFSTRQLDVDLPASPANINLELFLDGKKLSSLQTVDEDGNDIDSGRIVRLNVEPDLYRGPVVLDLRYQMPPGRTEGQAFWQTTFYPPRLRGNVFPGRVRWQVGLPAEWVPIATAGPTTIEQRLGLRGWLPAPRSGMTAGDLERWFTASSELIGSGPEANPELGTRSSDLVCWQGNLTPLVLFHLPEWAWLLTCSALLVLVGIGLYFVSGSPRLFAAGVGLVGLTIMSIGILRTNTLPVIFYGSLPGMAVLLPLLSYLWWRQDRYRRQVVFMPGFTRMSSGSSVIRTGSSQRRRSEPSTVDAPKNPMLAPPPEPGSRQEMVPRQT